jgi:Sigma2 domain of PhyR/Response regulator PhyR, sigma-like domain
MPRQFPWLCRYARALTGSAPAGDDLALSAALTLREAPPRRRAAVRGALFRALSTLLAAPAKVGPRTDAVAPVAPRWMQMLLLHGLERFSPRQMAHILGVRSRRLRELAAEAATAQQADEGRKVLILDTDPLVSLDISSNLENWGYHVVGMPSSPGEAFSLVRREQPDVIILTSALRFGDSYTPLFDAEELARICGSSLVLVTADPQRFLRGELGEWAFIIGKPYQHAALGPMVSQSLRARAVSDA